MKLEEGAHKFQLKLSAVVQYLHPTNSGLEASPPVKLLSATVSPGVKRLENETDRLFPSSAEFKNTWSYPTISPYVVMLWGLTEHRDRAWCTVWSWLNVSCLERGTKVSERGIFWYRVALFLGISYSVLNILHISFIIIIIIVIIIILRQCSPLWIFAVNKIFPNYGRSLTISPV